MADVKSFLDVAAVLADGQAVDWEAAERLAVTEADRSLLTELRFIAAITRDPISRDGSSSASASSHPMTSAKPAALENITPTTIPDKWGPLTVIERVGGGTFGEIYRAWDSRLDREVALKVLRRREREDERQTSTAVQEGRLLARVRHPNVATVYGAERVDGRVGVWMEYVHGKTLEEELAEHGPFDVDRVIAIGIELGSALATVHRAGVIHRDVKTQNVMVDCDGRLVLTDFGAGVELEERPDTDARELAGTPLCVAPEVLAGQPATPRSDIYSLGVLLYHLLTRTYPVRGRTLKEVRAAHASGIRVNLAEARPDLPPGLAQTIDRALDPDPRRRFDTPDSFATDLRAFASTGSTARETARRLGRHAVRAATLLAAFGIGSMTVGDRTKPPTRQQQATSIAAFSSPRGTSGVATLAAAPLTFQSEKLTIIEFPGATRTDLFEINDHGVVVGSYVDSHGITHGFRMSDGSFTILDVPDAVRTRPTGLNNDDLVVGDFTDASGRVRGFIGRAQAFTTIDVPGATSTRAGAVNNLGAVAGDYIDADGRAHGFVLSGGVVTSVDVPGATSTRAVGLNDDGSVVGDFRDAAGAQHGFLFSEGRFSTIDMPHASATQAFGINREGTIVGSYLAATAFPHGFSFSGGKFVSIDVPGAVQTQASAINSSGVIVGLFRTTAPPRTRGFLLTP
ncbi:MAG: protein kinase domain-containing protein [Vicinamibacterales bacterium]